MAMSSGANEFNNLTAVKKEKKTTDRLFNYPLTFPFSRRERDLFVAGQVRNRRIDIHALHTGNSYGEVGVSGPTKTRCH